MRWSGGRGTGVLEVGVGGSVHSGEKGGGGGGAMLGRQVVLLPESQSQLS